MNTHFNESHSFMTHPLMMLLIPSLFLFCLNARAQDEETDAISESDEGEEEPVNLDEEEAIDLDDLEEEESSAPDHTSHEGHGGGHGGGMSSSYPRFKLFFDFLTEYEFETEKFQFTSEHSYVMLDLDATPWLGFRADLSFNPEFFEIIFHLGPSFEVSMGKVLVPFGQNDWHHLIGGRVDNQSIFLPTLWADYGISLKHRLIDGDYASFSYSLYAVNGFQEARDDYDNPFPSRNAGYLEDNNKMKGVGIRPTLYLDFLKATIGTSWYFDAFGEENKGKMLFYGVDLDLGYGFIPAPVLKNLRLRAEAAWGEIQLYDEDGVDRNYYQGIMEYGSRRAGYNLEASFKIIPILTLRYREGYLNSDSRFRDWGDMRVHEPAIITRVGPVVFYLCAQFIQPLVTQDEEDALEELGITQNVYSSVFLRVMLQY